MDTLRNSRGHKQREQQLLDMLNGGDWANAPWERAPDQDDATSIAFRGHPCDLSECRHPVHKFDHPRRSLRHLEWFNREPVQSVLSNAEEMS